MKELEIVKTAVQEAGEAILDIYESELEVNYKDDKSPVTSADLKAEAILFERLKNFGYPFLSEESVDDLGRLNAKRVWIIDPLDGTKDFIQKTGDFSIIVGLVEDGKPVLGVIYKPVGAKLYYAVRGEGAYLVEKGQTRRLQVSKETDFEKFRMCVSRNHILPLEKKLSKKLGIKDLITSGSAGLKAALIAEGKSDLYINSSNKTSEWDVCAGEVIIKEAGGILVDLKGREIVYNKRHVKNMDGYIFCNNQNLNLLLEQLSLILDQ